MFLSKTSFVNVAASSTDSLIISGLSGKIIRVIGGDAISAGTATNITFNSKGPSSGTAITATKPFGANGGCVWPLPAQSTSGEPPFGYFETNKGEALTVTTGAGATLTGITLTYVTLG